MGVFRRGSKTPSSPPPSQASRAARTLSQAPLRTAPFSAHRSLVASARLVNVSTNQERAAFQRRRQSSQSWQDEAWAYIDAIGEIKYALGLVANTLSRVRLYVGVVDDPSVAPRAATGDSPSETAARTALTRLESAFGGTPGMLRDLALNLQAVGEANLVQVPANPVTGAPESWDVRSTDELLLDPSTGSIVISPTAEHDKESQIVLPKGAFVARIWRPHPRFSDEADSSMRGLLDAAAELLLLNKTFRSTARSRLNSGLLYLPDGLSVSSSAEHGPGAGQDPLDLDPLDPSLEDPDYDPALDPDTGIGPGVLVDETAADDEDDFEEALLEAMTTPIADEESASAVVPLIVRGPQDLGEKIKLIKFDRTFDPALATRADRVLDRIMQGLDVPKEIVQGVADVKYANAQVIDEQLYSSHIEPLALLICDALTSVYLRPSLKAAGIPEAERGKFVVWYDASEVTTRPNKADDAEQGFQNYAVSWKTWRRTHNFTEEDAPEPLEVATRMLLDKGPMSPELAEALLGVIAPDVMEKVRDASQASNPAPLPPEVANALGLETPAQPPPEQQQQQQPEDEGEGLPFEDLAPENPAPPATPATPKNPEEQP